MKPQLSTIKSQPSQQIQKTVSSNQSGQLKKSKMTNKDNNIKKILKKTDNRKIIAVGVVSFVVLALAVGITIAILAPTNKKELQTPLIAGATASVNSEASLEREAAAVDTTLKAASGAQDPVIVKNPESPGTPVPGVSPQNGGGSQEPSPSSSGASGDAETLDTDPQVPQAPQNSQAPQINNDRVAISMSANGIRIIKEVQSPDLNDN